MANKGEVDERRSRCSDDEDEIPATMTNPGGYDFAISLEFLEFSQSI